MLLNLIEREQVFSELIDSRSYLEKNIAFQEQIQNIGSRSDLDICRKDKKTTFVDEIILTAHWKVKSVSILVNI